MIFVGLPYIPFHFTRCKMWPDKQKKIEEKTILPHFCYICKSRRQNERDRKEKVASSTNDNNIARLREVAADLS